MVIVFLDRFGRPKQRSDDDGAYSISKGYRVPLVNGCDAYSGEVVIRAALSPSDASLSPYAYIDSHPLHPIPCIDL